MSHELWSARANTAFPVARIRSAVKIQVIPREIYALLVRLRTVWRHKKLISPQSSWVLHIIVSKHVGKVFSGFARFPAQTKTRHHRRKVMGSLEGFFFGWNSFDFGHKKFIRNFMSNVRYLFPRKRTKLWGISEASEKYCSFFVLVRTWRCRWCQVPLTLDICPTSCIGRKSFSAKK